MTSTIPCGTLPPSSGTEELESLDLYASVELGTNPGLKAANAPTYCPPFCDDDCCLNRGAK